MVGDLMSPRMFIQRLVSVFFLQSVLAVNLRSSGAFVSRVKSPHDILLKYCYTELPYEDGNGAARSRGCVFSGELEISSPEEHILRLLLRNITKEHLNIEVEIIPGDGRPPLKLSKRFLIDGSHEATRIGFLDGTVIEFLTVCDRPFFGLRCARRCEQHNGANYVCTDNGHKACHLGWTGKNCDVVEEGDPDNTLLQFSTTTELPTAMRELSSVKAETSRTSPIMPTVTTTAVSAGTTYAVTTDPGPPVDASTARRLAVLPTSRVVATTTTATRRTKLRDASFETTPIVSPPSGINGPSQHSNIMTASPVLDLALMCFILTVLLALSAYGLVRLARSAAMQNWINMRRSKIFTAQTSGLEHVFSKHDVATEMASKELKEDVESAEAKRMFHKEQLFSAQQRATSRLSQSSNTDQPTAGDISLVESQKYHEIDSFLVEQRIATLV